MELGYEVRRESFSHKDVDYQILVILEPEGTHKCVVLHKQDGENVVLVTVRGDVRNPSSEVTTVEGLVALAKEEVRGTRG
jgi:hypothetical protein